MNFNKFINSDYLKSNPLCGINTYKDELNLATGACTRQIEKLVLTGQESWSEYGTGTGHFYYISLSPYGIMNVYPVCSHYTTIRIASDGKQLRIYESYESTTDFTTYLQQQYANGTPVTIWYILETPTTETITVPSGLSGTEEGYLNQSGTPTPTNPIYPTANTVEQWFDLNHYIMGTSTDTLTTLPADLYADGNSATVGLVGNMAQSGAPSPTTPIQPSECGDLTENLFDKSTITTGAYAINTGIRENASYYCSDYIPITATTYYFQNVVGKSIQNAMVVYDSNKQFTRYVTIQGGQTTSGAVTFENGEAYIRINCFSSTDVDTVMVNIGNSPQSIQPHGYKIPISSNSTTTPVYLGEVESTRQIYKLVLTGQETISISSSYYLLTIAVPANDRNNFICSHFGKGNYTGAIAQGNLRFSQGGSVQYDTILFNYDNGTGGEANFKTYLQQQYANGTPVTVWYVLATPTTGIVNEPLRKIGDYADEISGITIPTIAGANTLLVDTTLQPSEVTVNYKGWHPVADVHERESGQWT